MSGGQPKINFDNYTSKEFDALKEAAFEVLECHRILAQTGDNIVGELLPTAGTFYEYDHCPPGDIFDHESHCQYYYHAHREGEHGHFHIFMREKGMPKDCRPARQSEAEYLKKGEEKVCHLVAISMDSTGIPISLFTTNRWVTAESWYPAKDVLAMIERFEISHAKPSWVVNRWITAMLRLFRPQIAEVLKLRDAAVAKWKKEHPGEDAFENRELDLPSMIDISIDDQIQAMLKEINRRGIMRAKMAMGRVKHPYPIARIKT